MTRSLTFELAAAFERYIWLLRELQRRASGDSRLRAEFSRIADLELAFFARSRTSQIRGSLAIQSLPEFISDPDLDDESCIRTLGKSTAFWAHEEGGKTVVYTGSRGRTVAQLSTDQIEACLGAFTPSEWFPLGNCIDHVRPDGLGWYFKQMLKMSSKFASHFAALWVTQGLLEADRRGNAIWLRRGA